MPSLFTPRLELRPWTPQSVIAAMAGPIILEAALKVRVDRGWPNKEFAEALPVIADDLIAHGEHGLSALLLLKESSMVIGEIGCKGGPDDEGALEIGYGIVPAHRGKGLATEAVGALVKHIFTITKATAVKAEVETGNVASVKVLQKVGFKPASAPRVEPGAVPLLAFALPRVKR